MPLSRDIIHSNKSTHSDFDYYNTIIEKIEKNHIVNPDISIESSKALIEGVSKSILIRLETAQTETTVNAMDFPELFRNACWSIQRHGSFEVDFVHRSATMIQKLAEIRNSRGDISHGRATPKKNNSTKESSKMIMHVTDAIVHYMLEAFFKIDLSYKDDLGYEDNPEFNESLDGDYNVQGISYSKALFDQDPTTYEEELESYKELIEQEE